VIKLRTRDERGVAYPSPLVMLSIVAIVMAGVAFWATRNAEPAEREVETASQEQITEATTDPTSEPSQTPTTKKPKPKEPAVVREDVQVVVFNNSGITGLAGTVAADVGEIGWNVVGSDNWYGTIPQSTVYYPPKLKAAGEKLGLDLGISRVQPAVDPMATDRLTVILTADAA
jgi:LytR cell envelope-related transcriptional attenuator